MDGFMVREHSGHCGVSPLSLWPSLEDDDGSDRVTSLALTLPNRAFCIPSLILREGQKGSVSDVARPLPNETSIGFSLDLQGR